MVNSVRVRPEAIRLDGAAAGAIRVRVEMPDVWDTVLIEAAPTATIEQVKLAALEALWPDAQFADDFVIKLRGFEVFDERRSLADAGARNGTIFLLTFRRRRPVR